MDFDGLNWWGLVYFAVEWAIRLGMLAVVPFRRTPEAAKSWLLLFFFLPIPALFAYLVIGRPDHARWRKERIGRIPDVTQALHREVAHSACCRRPVLPANLQQAADLIAGLGDFPAMSGNKVELIADYDSAIERLVRDIDEARHTVHLLYYIFSNDETGQKIISALAAAARRGVVCRVLIDAVGSQKWAGSVIGALRGNGVEAHEIMPIGLFRLRTRPDLRNHRKLAVIDSRVGFVGSQNIVSAAATGAEPNRELVARIDGPLALEMQSVFAGDWYLETEQEPDGTWLVPHQHPGTGVIAQILASGPDQGLDAIARILVALIHGAKSQVTIATPYFIPDTSLLQALTTAVLRGVQVDLILPEEGDHKMVQLAQRSYLQDLLVAGVRVHSYRSGFLHAKHISIDDEIAILGSSNIDIRSFRLNAELNVILFDKIVAAELIGMQQRYIADSRQLIAENWMKRPVLRQFVEKLMALVSPLL